MEFMSAYNFICFFKITGDERTTTKLGIPDAISKHLKSISWLWKPKTTCMYVFSERTASNARNDNNLELCWYTYVYI